MSSPTFPRRVHGHRDSRAPEVSVIMPVRNGGVHLQPAVDSILAQSLTSLELIIIDDGSTDGATQRLGGADPRVQIYENPVPGLIGALNTGLGLARAPWIARMDADDLATGDRLERQLAHGRAHPELGLIGAQVDIFSDSGRIDDGYRVYQDWINSLTSPEDIAREIYVESPIPHPTAFMRRATVEQLGGYRDCGWPEDYDLWLRMHAAGVAMGKPEGILLRWRDYPTRTSRLDERYSNAQFMALRAKFLAADQRLQEPVMICGAGKNGRRLFDELQRRGTGICGFIDVSPKRIGGRVRNVPVMDARDVATIKQFIVVAVGSRGARTLIRNEFHKHGKIEGLNYVFAL